jgi:glycosyltransferase involved in cell wall biosynthesis
LKNSIEAQKRGNDNQRRAADFSWGRSAEIIEKVYCDLLKTCKN